MKDVLIATIPSIIPSVIVGIGIMINKNDINRVFGEISTLRVRVEALGDTLHEDIMTMVKISNDLDKRVSRMEDNG